MNRRSRGTFIPKSSKRKTTGHFQIKLRRAAQDVMNEPLKIGYSFVVIFERTNDAMKKE